MSTIQDSHNRRLNLVAAILFLLAILVSYRLIELQFGINTAYFAATALTEYRYKITVRPPRGEIYDRDGVLLATNSVEYEIGLSPILVVNREKTAADLSAATGIPYEDLMADLSSPAPYILLARPASASMGQAVLALNLDGVSVTPLSRRFYPHGSLAAHLLGFVAGDGVGYYGIEGYYNELLSGKVKVSDESRIPFEATGGTGLEPGATLYLTIDSETQYLAESALAQAIQDTGAASGTIIVIDPKTGEILAMASLPTFDPNIYQTSAAENPAILSNPAISDQYEPGSVMKVMTMGIALENGVVTPDSTYNDTGSIEVGGVIIRNWDRQAYGTTSMTDLLAHSLNVGAAELSLGIGPTKFYAGLADFGYGEPTGIDLQGEAGGLVRMPGDSNWHESDLAENSFGQAIAVTPIQTIVAMGAVANDGLIMQPHMVLRRIDHDGTVIEFSPATLGRALSSPTADTLNRMLFNSLQRESSPALVEGYSIAGKTGTAEIPIPGGYDPTSTIASFVGWGPMDDPQFVVLIKLDRPTISPFGSETAAPAFGKLVARLVVILEIPPDAVRVSAGGG